MVFLHRIPLTREELLGAVKRKASKVADYLKSGKLQQVQCSVRQEILYLKVKGGFIVIPLVSGDVVYSSETASSDSTEPVREDSLRALLDALSRWVRYVEDLSDQQWVKILEMCPLECSLSQITSGDYVDAVDENGLACKRASHNFVNGTLTAVSEQFGWRFYHPGFKGGSFYVQVFNLDTSPRYGNISIQVSE